MLSDSKDAIKNRMIRNIAGIWGYPDSQDINSFDPVVGMILGALAEEIYNISGEIKKTDARIVEKLFELLIGQDVFAQFPAHAMARARPTQPEVSISELFQFSFIKKTPKIVNEETIYINKPIWFTPTKEFKLFKCEIKYLSGGSQLFEISDQTKETLAVIKSGIMPDFSKMYIGLKMDAQIDKIDGLSLMFSIRDKNNEERFYSSIINARWKINDNEIIFRKGFEQQNIGKGNNLSEIFRNEVDLSYKTCNYVNEFYNDKFMTVTDNNFLLKNLVKSNQIPEEFKRKFPEHTLKSIPGDILWIEVQLSQSIDPEILNDLTISLNCFPVVNRKLNEFSQLLTRGFNIIPMTTEDLFFDIKTITDTKGSSYRALNSFTSENAEDEGYIIRQGGVARFDSRDAKETINHLIDLIRDERASFSLLGTDMISSELKQLDQIISRLKQRMESIDLSDSSNSYLLLNCNSGYERANIQFWTINGEIANNIRSYSRLNIHQGADLDSNSVILISNSFGGKQKLTKEDKLNKLRRMLLSKGRVVTREDIKALCFEQFGKEITNVEIKKGVHLDPSMDKGFVRSLDIYLTINKDSQLTDNELEQKTDELKIRLKQETINLLPYRIYTSQNHSDAK